MTCQCSHRLVSCPHTSIGCSVHEIPANELDHHLLYDCESKPWNERSLLVERARQRQNYPRPWGISLKPLIEDISVSNESTTPQPIVFDDEISV